MCRFLMPCLVACAVLVPGAAAVAQDQDAEQQNEAQWMIVLHGDVAVAEEDEVVSVAEPRAVAFTDRPECQARVLDTSTAVEELAAENTTAANQPNAAVASEQSDETAVITIEDLTQQIEALTLTYDLLEGTIPAVGDHMILTIDGVAIHFGPNPGDG